ncbi:metallophosphoesterase family protein [Oceanobacillus halophilus]|uniref:Metallophosphoesterase n=1 Tax=Oceanobacillus halophilus TaxID=930130 RepID=A0A494ZT29_9BACI|nr:metallophosphoesterase family protein [Oceanobacillus halophilus]RKQ29267.1 metallophosphoesterase [Oceanobacillus halophilus]
MKIAFISDVHGNAVALESVLEDVERKNVDKVVVLGDLCFRGPEPKRSLNLVQSLHTDVVKGNADEWVVRGIQEGEVPDPALKTMREEREWTYEKLTETDIDYLRNLPSSITTNLTNDINIQAFHATPNSLFDVVQPSVSDEELATKLMTDETADIFLYGHIHLPYVRYIKGKCVANLGSVGLPFDGLNYASYLIAEGDKQQFNVGIQRVPYDVDRVVKQLKDVGYPNLEFLTGVIKRGML